MTAIQKTVNHRADHSHAACHRRALQNRRDFQVIYGIMLAAFLICLPWVRLVSLGRSRRSRERLSIVGQARAEAGIVASYALMGY